MASQKREIKEDRMSAVENKVPTWIKKSIAALFIISLLLIAVCILVLDSADRTKINIITIIGTVFGAVGIGIAIYQQIHLISVSDAINTTTTSISLNVRDIHYEMNILGSVRCLEKIEHYLSSDADSKRIQIKLGDLHDHITECKKILEANKNTSDTGYTKFCAAESKIIKYEVQILTSDYSISPLKKAKSENFSNFVVELKNELNQVKRLPYFI